MQKKDYIAFIGTNSVRGSQGIYTVQIDGDSLQAKVISTQEAYNTGALALSHSKKYLYAASEGMTFGGTVLAVILGVILALILLSFL